MPVLLVSLSLTNDPERGSAPWLQCATPTETRRSDLHTSSRSITGARTNQRSACLTPTPLPSRFGEAFTIKRKRTPLQVASLLQPCASMTIDGRSRTGFCNRCGCNAITSPCWAHSPGGHEDAACIVPAAAARPQVIRKMGAAVCVTWRCRLGLDGLRQLAQLKPLRAGTLRSSG